MNPLVSIVLPTYNGEKYIRKSIESCLSQSYTNLELIIVNDCSKDNTLSIVKEYAARDSRVKVINNAKNKKLPLSLNAGFEEATGTYFTWTSDDNFYTSNAIECLVTAITSHQNIDLVYTDYFTIDDSDQVTGEMHFGDINQSFMEWKGCGACFLYHAEVHKKNNGYDPSTVLIEDYDFFLRAYLHSTFLYLKRSDLYYYRLHAASLTGTMSDAVFDIQKITVEKRIPILLPKLKGRDITLLYRKYTVYYSLFKNNNRKTAYFLELLYRQSVSQAILTIFYIAGKKMLQYFQVVPFLFYSFIRLLFKGGRSEIK